MLGVLKYFPVHRIDSSMNHRNLFLIAIPIGVSLLFPRSSYAESATKRFQYTNVPLSSIYNEWIRKNGDRITMYACVCTKSSCDSTDHWPFKNFSVGEVVPALGEFNSNSYRSTGFRCSIVQP